MVCSQKKLNLAYSVKPGLISLVALLLGGFLLVGCESQDGVSDKGLHFEKIPIINVVQEVVEDDNVQEIADIVIDDTNIFEFVTLGQYLGIEYYFITATPVTEEQIDEWIFENMSQSGVVVQITDRAAEFGDTVIIDFEGFHNGVPFERGSAEGVDLQIGSNLFIPGFEEQIIGHYTGDEFDIHLTFPDDYFEPSLAGEDVVFRINLISINAQAVPELTDEMVQEHLGMDSVEEYRFMLREQMDAERISNAENEMRNQVWGAIVNNATVSTIPESEVELRIERALMRYYFYAMMYSIEIEELFELFFGMTYDEFVENNLRIEAINSVESDLVVRAIAVQEGISLSDEEFEEMVAQLVIDMNFENVEQFFEINSEHVVRISLLFEKVLEFVMERAVQI